MSAKTASLYPARDDGLPAAELLLVDLAQWLARVLQYSASHPSSAAYAVRAHASLSRALEAEPVLAFFVQKDGVLMGDVAATHRAVVTRLAPHLHHRGVQAFRFTAAARAEDLAGFVELLALRVQSTFDGGGLRYLLLERGIRGVAVEEIAHDVDVVEREAQNVRRHLRGAFADGLRAARGGRWMRGLSGETLLELLDAPEVAVLVLEEDPIAIAEAVAALCQMVRQEEARSGRSLFPKLRAILLALSPPSHARVLVGLPALVGTFRAALLWALDGLSEPELARLALPALRGHVTELDLVFYAASIAIPHDGRRLSTFRWLALRLHDLPGLDGIDRELCDALAQPVDEADSFGRERVVLQAEALRAIAARTPSPTSLGAPSRARGEAPPLDARRVMEDVVRLAERAPRFDRVLGRLPPAAARLATDGTGDAILGLLHGLRGVSGADRERAARAASAIATPEVVASMLDDLDRESASAESLELVSIEESVKMLATARPDEAWTLLERSENLKMQRMLLDALAGAGPLLLPRAIDALCSENPNAVRHAASLLPRIGGRPSDLEHAARHPNERVRREVLRALRAMPLDATAMDLLVAYLTDASPELQKAARPMLRGDLLTPRAIAELRSLADASDLAIELRERIVEVLAHSTRDEAAAALFALLAPQSLLELGTFREGVARALRRCRAPKAASYFAEGLKSPIRRVRWACEKAASD